MNTEQEGIEDVRLIEEMVSAAEAALTVGAKEVGNHGTWRVDESGDLKFAGPDEVFFVYPRAAGWAWEWCDYEGETSVLRDSYADRDAALRAAVSYHVDWVMVVRRGGEIHRAEIAAARARGSETFLMEAIW